MKYIVIWHNNTWHGYQEWYNWEHANSFADALTLKGYVTTIVYGKIV